jgi:hypothetical protein
MNGAATMSCTGNKIHTFIEISICANCPMYDDRHFAHQLAIITLHLWQRACSQTLVLSLKLAHRSKWGFQNVAGCAESIVDYRLPLPGITPATPCWTWVSWQAIQLLSLRQAPCPADTLISPHADPPLPPLLTPIATRPPR